VQRYAVGYTQAADPSCTLSCLMSLSRTVIRFGETCLRCQTGYSLHGSAGTYGDGTAVPNASIGRPLLRRARAPSRRSRICSFWQNDLMQPEALAQKATQVFGGLAEDGYRPPPALAQAVYVAVTG